ncbi:DUF418 domain-containing protein [Nesterenkonia alba]|uniref:DUF418 domain-containing protein n=1 Tax=Nesterenkonia alba TaxID=515814 RepID=UPI0003B5FDED|nr:DUF418 domain-containing protein [Nesterenkonia alba]
MEHHQQPGTHDAAGHPASDPRTGAGTSPQPGHPGWGQQPPQAPEASATPRRLDAVDALRALALLGIISVNVWFFTSPEAILGEMTNPPESSADQLVRFASTAIFEGKSYVVFSFLFGLSFVLAWASAHRQGADVKRRAKRRSVGLIVLGVLHGFFLFMGDILLAYGLLGLLLFAMRNTRTKTALIVAGVFYAVGATLFVGLGALSAVFDAITVEGDADIKFTLVDPALLQEWYSGGVLSYFGFQAIAYPLAAINIIFGQGILAFACLLVGLVVGRERIIERTMAGEFSTARLLSIGLPCLLAGGAVSLIGAWLAWGPPGSAFDVGVGTHMLGQTLAVAAGPFQAAGYVILLLLAFRSGAFDLVLRVLAPAGRMSLSNYLGQSLVLALLFSGLGFGLAGELNAGLVGLIVVLIWLGQIIFSHLWLARFKRGPVEIPFRAWTYKA